MQPKGRQQYIFDSVSNVWVPWEGTAVGFGGVTLFTTDGVAIDTPTGQQNDVATVRILGVAAYNYAFDTGSSGWDKVRVFSNTADALATADGLTGVQAFAYGFNGSTFDRTRSFAGNADNITAPTLGLLGCGAFQLLFDGTNYDRARSLVDNADDVAVATVGLAGTVSRLTAFDGTTYDRLRTASAANLSAATAPAPLLVATPGDWSINHAPAANTQATITRAAGGAGVRHVCTSITAVLSAAAAATSGVVQINLRDGGTGAGTILWSATVQIGGAASISGGAVGISLSGLRIFGTANTAMTLEFSAAGGADTTESVALTGHDSV